MSFWQENKIPLSIVLAGFIIGFFIFLSQKSQFINQSQSNSFISPTLAVNQKVIPTQQLKQTPIPTQNLVSPTTNPFAEEIIDKKIKQALIVKININEEDLDYRLGEKIKSDQKMLFRGVVGRRNEEGGAMFFGYCDQNQCQITFVGQGVPKCSEVNPYGYPKSWADYCLDESHNVIPR